MLGGFDPVDDTVEMFLLIIVSGFLTTLFNLLCHTSKQLLVYGLSVL